MYQTISNLTRQQVCTAIHNNALGICRLGGTSPHYHVHDTTEMFYVDHGVNHPAYQGVMLSNMNSENVEQKIDEVISYYKSRNLSPSVYIHQDCKPEDLDKHLEAKGFTHVDGAIAMAADLNKLRNDRPSPPGLTIEYVKDDSTLRTFFDVWTEGYGYPEAFGDVMYDIMSTIDDGHSESMMNYLGYLEGVPVATSSLYNDGSVAGLWWVSTLPIARGKGIGTEMTLYPLREARQQGYQMSVLLSTEIGHPLYKKLGYEDYYPVKIYVCVGN